MTSIVSVSVVEAVSLVRPPAATSLVPTALPCTNDLATFMSGPLVHVSVAGS